MTTLVDDYLAHRFKWRPVDATFMGIKDHDHRLPLVGAGCIETEISEIEALLDRINADQDLHPHDRQMIQAELTCERAALKFRPRQKNPAWATGEVGFSILSLLLPQSAPWRIDAITDRLAAIPDFLKDVRKLIGDGPVPAGWVERAEKEAEAVALFLLDDIQGHDAWSDDWAEPAAIAARELAEFSKSLAGLPDKDPACGKEHMDLLLCEMHMLETPSEAIMQSAQSAFDRCAVELEQLANEIDPNTSWQDQIATLSSDHPASATDVPATYRHWDTTARDAAVEHGLVTPEREYELDYRELPDCFQRIAKSMYFLFYRSPPARNPGEGSVYWIMPSADLSAHNTSMVKAIHAVHHGSVGHHTQNAHARAAGSQMGRIAATDCSMGLAFQGALTLVEGWACHVEDLMMEAEGFYSPAEKLLLKSFERRNAASVLVDLGLHSGVWTQAECERFYAEEAGFAPARVHGEIIRNSIFPTSRATYWLGVEGIRALRRRWTGSTQDFHDRLLSFGHVPLRLVEEEMVAAKELSD